MTTSNLFLNVFFFVIFNLIYSTDYHVGPSQAYSTIGEAISLITTGDTIFVHVSPSPYLEKFVIGFDGVSIIGVVENGVLPIIDGENAVQPTSQDFTNGNRGIIKIGTANSPSSTCPSNILVSNLHIRNARPPMQFTGRNQGIETYSSHAGGIYIECVKNVIIRGNEIENTGNGIFTGIFGGETQNILIEQNYIHSSGIVGSWYEHNLYCSAVGIVYQFNHFGKLCNGCDGNNLKDRSVGTVIRYNFIEDGNRQIDLVELSNTDYGHLRAMPAYRKAFVYGNVIAENLEDGNRQMIHYGGDSGEESTYRKGKLYLFSNTFISKIPGRTTLLRLSSNEESCDAFNNVIYNTEPGDQFEMLSNERGVLNLFHNYIRNGFFVAVEMGGGGYVTFSNNIHSDDDPGFTDLNGGDYTLTEGSILLGSAMRIRDWNLYYHKPVKQYVKHLTYLDRNNVRDLGAFALNPGSFDPAEVISTLFVLPGTIIIAIGVLLIVVVFICVFVFLGSVLKMFGKKNTSKV